MADKKDFFFMGCWNNDSPFNKDINIDYRKAVLNLISQNKDKYNHGIILGDNIYPSKKEEFQIEPKVKGLRLNKRKLNKRISKRKLSKNSRKLSKKKKKKNIRKKKIIGGASAKALPDKFFTQQTFNFLSDFLTKSALDIETYVILGNHDIEQCVPEKVKPLTLSKNVLLFSENTVIQKYDNYVLILLNTNEEHYYTTPGNKNTYVQVGIAAYLKRVLEELLKDKEFNKWVIICGHEPLASIKFKEKKAKGGKKASKHFTQNLRDVTSIYSVLQFHNYRKLIYLCADTHNFQFNEFSICEGKFYNTEQIIPKTSENSKQLMKETRLKIPIVVAGTGGADPDYLSHKSLKLEGKPKPVDIPEKGTVGIRSGTVVENFKHSIFGNRSLCVENFSYLPSFGYCDIDITPEVATVRYHHIQDKNVNVHTFTISNSNKNENSKLSVISGAYIYTLDFDLEELPEKEPVDLCAE